MENKISLSVILPIRSSKVRNFDEYFEKSIQSILNQSLTVDELVIVHTNEESLVNFLNEYDFKGLNVKKLIWEDHPNFCSQVNFGIKNSSNQWVSILEFDDEYSTIWFNNVAKYTESYPEFDAFLPIVVDTTNKEVFAGFTNEATFAANFSSEMGVLTNETLQNYQNFQSSGMVIKKDKFIDFGLIKPSIKLTFGWELFLRLTHNSVNIMSIPRIGYKHTNLREGSIFWNYKNGEDVLTDDEVKFWVETAKKEYLFINDRAIKYEPQEV